MSVSQTDFTQAILDPAAGIPTGLRDPAGDPAGRRFDVYRNNVAVSLTEALETAFPVLRKLLGDENFKGLSGIFLRQHPPSSPLMMFYGAEMPAFLAGMPQLAHLAYLPDIARLELAMRQAYHAADADPLAPEALDIAPDRLMAARLTPHPALRLIRSAWPIHAIWEFNMTEGAPKPQPGSEDVIVTRPEFDPVQTVLPAGAAAFLAAVTDGVTFGAAIDIAQADTPEFDLAATLGTCLAAGAFATIET